MWPFDKISGNNSSTTSKRGLDIQENAVTRKNNIFRGTNMTAKEQQGYKIWRQSEGKGTPEDYLKLPAAKRREYESVMGNNAAPNNGNGSRGLQVAFRGDSMGFSSEVTGAQQGEGSRDMEALLGALGANMG